MASLTPLLLSFTPTPPSAGQFETLLGLLEPDTGQCRLRDAFVASLTPSLLSFTHHTFFPPDYLNHCLDPRTPRGTRLWRVLSPTPLTEKRSGVDAVT